MSHNSCFKLSEMGHIFVFQFNFCTVKFKFWQHPVCATIRGRDSLKNVEETQSSYLIRTQALGLY